MQGISFFELLKKKNVNIIDIRSHEKYQAGHVDGAISIEYFELIRHPEKYLSLNEVYYLYCDSGVKSSYLANRLRSLGYKTVNILGGYQNYLFQK